MKKLLTIICIAIFWLVPANKVSAQSAEFQQLALNIEKLAQFKQILSDMKKGYQILEGGYNTVKDISKGNFKLHNVFLDGLLQVSSPVRNYKRVGEIINYQVVLIREYHNAYDRFRKDNNFNENEIAYIGNVYNRLLKESLRNLSELTDVLTAGKMRMSDDERLQSIDRIHSDMQEKLLFLRHFNNGTKVTAIQRAKEKNDAEAIRKIYGINN